MKPFGKVKLRLCHGNAPRFRDRSQEFKIDLEIRKLSTDGRLMAEIHLDAALDHGRRMLLTAYSRMGAELKKSDDFRSIWERRADLAKQAAASMQVLITNLGEGELDGHLANIVHGDLFDHTMPAACKSGRASGDAWRRVIAEVQLIQTTSTNIVRLTRRPRGAPPDLVRNAFVVTMDETWTALTGSRPPRSKVNDFTEFCERVWLDVAEGELKNLRRLIESARLIRTPFP